MAGPELAAAAPYIFAGGTAASMLGQRQQAKHQRRILNRAMQASDEDQAKGTAAALAEAQTMTADQRGQALEAEQQAAFERAMADSGQAQLGANLAPEARPAGSADYIRLKGERDASEGDRMTAVARELSKVRGVGSLQQNEAQRRGSLTESLGSMWSSGRQRTQAAQRDAESVDMPAIGQLGNMAQLVGGAAMMGGAPAAVPGTVGGASGGGLAGMDLWAESMMAPAAQATRPSIWAEALVRGSPMFQQRQGMFGGKR